MNGDIEVFTKSGNIGSGSIDWVVEGSTVSVLTEVSDILLQAVFKALITSPLTTGYGVGLPDFIGTKHIVPTKVGTALRMLKSLQCISQWYARNISLSAFNADLVSPSDGYKVSFAIEVSKDEIAQGELIFG
jgi:hypothetical protein